MPSSNNDLVGWSFLKFLSNVSSSPPLEKENVYVHPSTKKYSSTRLSEKSLELCTESLGSETGSDIIDIDFLSLPPSNSPKSPPREIESASSSSFSSKYTKVNNNYSRKFPPPLTTISGSNSIQFRPHREDGRLVIQAVEAPLKNTYFQAERSDGRLRLSFYRDNATKFDSQVMNSKDQENERAVEVARIDEENEVLDDKYEVGVDLDSDFREEECDGDDDDDDDESVEYMFSSGDLDENIYDVGVEMGMEKFQRVMNSRCNEGGQCHNAHKGLCNWPEPLWVATS